MCIGWASLTHCNRSPDSKGEDGPRPSAASATPSVAASDFVIELNPPSLGPPPTVHAVGQQGQARDYFMTLIGVRRCDVEPHFRAASGHVKLGAQVRIEGRTPKEVPVNPLLGTLEDSEHQRYRADLAGCTPSLPAGRVASGQLAEGFISFEVPLGASGLVMTYAPFVLGMGAEELRFAVEH